MKSLCFAAQIASLATIFYMFNPPNREAVIFTLLVIINNAAVTFRTYLTLKPLFRSEEFNE